MQIFSKPLTYAQIKDNLAIVLLVPTLLGGLWQIIELSGIGTPYLRFFSVSQLVSDGLMMLFILIWIYLPLTLFFREISLWQAIKQSPLDKFQKSLERNDALPNEKNVFLPRPILSHKERIANLIFLLFAISVYTVIFSISFWPEIIKPLEKDKTVSVIGLMGISLASCFTIATIKLMWSNLSETFGIKFNFNNPFVRLSYTLSVGFITMILLIFSLQAMRIFHRSFLLPSDFKNLDYIKCKIKAYNPDMKTFELVYFNDKYIFIDLTKKNKSQKIEVFKFEDFLNTQMCNNTDTQKTGE